MTDNKVPLENKVYVFQENVVRLCRELKTEFNSRFDEYKKAIERDKAKFFDRLEHLEKLLGVSDNVKKFLEFEDVLRNSDIDENSSIEDHNELFEKFLKEKGLKCSDILK